MFLFLSRNMSRNMSENSLLPILQVNFRKMEKSLLIEIGSFFQFKLEPFKLQMSLFRKVEISMILMECFEVSF